MSEDWDDDTPSGNTYSAPSFQPSAPTTGVIFGGRGRGFVAAGGDRGGFKRGGGGGDRGGRSFGDRPRRDNNDDNGGSGGFRGRDRNNENGGSGGFNNRDRNDENGGFRGRNRNDENGGSGGFNNRDRNDENGGFKRRDQNDENGDANGELEKPKAQTYIPPDVTEDDDELYGSGINSGINFNKYDEIPVHVSGEGDIPPGIRSFEESGLRKFLIETVQKCHYSKPTPVQKRAIPIILGGRDVMACAQTGSGKTAAFLLPIINELLQDLQPCTDGDKATPQCVIMSPTRELASQICTEAIKFTKGTGIIPCAVYGGTQMGHAIGKLQRGCHIIVATPGRLLDFVDRQRISFSALRYLVLDEADRMLDMGFQSSIDKMVKHETMVPKTERQTLMFSATFPDAIQSMAGQYLNNYLFITVGIVGGACSDVEQRFIKISRNEKLSKVVEIINEANMGRTVVFVETKRLADFLAVAFSERRVPSTSIHGDREQFQREEALRDFRSGKMKVLIATAVASRGLDIKDVAHVINYDLPKEIDEYVHRIGRTGRLGNRGLATSFFDDSGNDANLAPSLVRILEQAGQEVPDFLASASGGRTTDFDHNRSGFGGQDTRKGGFIQKEQPAQQDDDEAWD